MELIVGMVCCLIFSIFSYETGIFDKKGSIMAFLLGFAVFFLADLYWLLLLIFFVLMSYIATVYRAKEKVKKHWIADESVRGENNIVANGLVPIVIVLLYFFIDAPYIKLGYITAIAVASADTFASEIGILSDDVYLITNMNRIRGGTDGGISLLGQIAALTGAFIAAFFGWLLLFRLDTSYALVCLVGPTLFGFLGCQIDSLLGATLERGGRLRKGGVNFFSIALTTLLSFLFYV